MKAMISTVPEMYTVLYSSFRYSKIQPVIVTRYKPAPNPLYSPLPAPY